jgi:hypothetical protein
LNIRCIESFRPQKKELLFGITHFGRGPHLTTETQPLNLMHGRLPPRLSWSWTVLLPSDTHRKHIMSITAVTSICDLLTDSPTYRDFSKLATNKTKNRNRFHVRYDMHVVLSKVTPQFKVLLQVKQQESS